MQHLIGRRLLAAASASLLALPRRSRAEDWVPRHPIHLIVGFAPGGATDLLARGLAQAAQDLVPVPIHVENLPGAAGEVAAELVARPSPEKVRLLVSGGSECISVPHYRPVPYDPQRDFRHLLQVARYRLLLCVKGDSPFLGIEDLMDRAKSVPGDVAYASPGVGSLYQSVFVALGRRAGAEMVHVPYTGGAPALEAVANGEVTVTIGTPDECKSLVESGALRPLAVASQERAPEFPHVPTLVESGWKVTLENLKGLSVSATTPEPLCAGLYDLFHRVLATPTWKAFARRAQITTAELDGIAYARAMQDMSEAIAKALQKG